MESIQNFDFFRLPFDADGNLTDTQAFEDFKQHASAGATDAILIAHGFRNDEAEATGLYTGFLTTFRVHVDGPFHQSLGSRRYVVAGVYWPSKPFRETVGSDGSAQALDPDAAEKEELKLRLQTIRDTDALPAQKPKLDRAIKLLDTVEDNPAAQDEFVDLVFSLLDGTELDPTEGVDRIRAAQGSELLDKLKTPIILPTAAADEGGAAAVGDVFVPGQEGRVEGISSFVGSIFGRIGQFLNLTLWYVMKNRSGVVGANGVAKAVRDLKAAAPAIRVHLVGHSLGGRLMAGCAKTLAVSPAVRPDSLTLLEAAFSHYGFSANNGKGQVGFFRSVVAPTWLVKGPVIATFSAQDSVVGTIYAIASRLAGDNVQEIGDANDPFGGIGRNGAQKTDGSISDVLRGPGSAPYQFPLGKIVSLDGSGGLIQNHGDVMNTNVTFAFASAVALT